MLARVLQHLLNLLNKALRVLKVNPAVRAAIAISFGAIPGALSRYFLTLVLTDWLGSGFPYATLMINLSGALFMGFFTTLALARAVSADLRIMITVGFLGSYTTFSTEALDTDTLLWRGSIDAALVYWAGSAILFDLRLMITVGFFGSYTTFSTYALDTATLVRIGDRRSAVFYWAGSAILGVLSLEIGRCLGKML